MQKIRLLIDEDVDVAIVAAARLLAPGIDLLTVRDSGLKGRPDCEVLRFAAENGRIVVSCDRNTMTAAFYEFVATASSPGLNIVPQRLDPGTAIDDLQLMWEASNADEYRDYIIWLPLNRGE